MEKIVSAAIIVCLINIFLKQQRPEYALVLSFLSAVLIITFAVPYLMEIVESARDFAYKIDAGREYIAVAVKICGISALVQIASEICRDAGEGALAQNVEFAGKCIMLFTALPVVGALFDAIEGVFM